METIRFEELNLDAKILRAVTDMGFEAASPIQAKAIPLELEGKDIIGQAQTEQERLRLWYPLLEKIDPKIKSCRQLCSALPETGNPGAEEIRILQNTCTGSRYFPFTEVRKL